MNSAIAATTISVPSDFAVERMVIETSYLTVGATPITMLGAGRLSLA
jgi:hypothetical protein